MNNVEGNYFGDAKSLSQGFFPQMHALYVYGLLAESRRKLTEQYFPAKMQARSLKYLCTPSIT